MRALPQYLMYNVYRDEVNHDLLRANWENEVQND